MPLFKCDDTKIVYSHYTGDYEVTPKSIEQKLYTKHKILDNDVKVKGIYFNETENESGGYTAYIGEE